MKAMPFEDISAAMAGSPTSPERKTAGLSHFYGFPWEGDMGNVLRIWKKQRNPLAHGSGRGYSDEKLSRIFAAWSRITGAFYRLVLAEIGYVGWFRYSPVEPGLEELKLIRGMRLIMTVPQQACKM